MVENSKIRVGKAASNPFMFNHLKWIWSWPNWEHTKYLNGTQFNHLPIQFTESEFLREALRIVPTCDSEITWSGIQSWTWTTFWRGNHNIQMVPLWPICVNAFTKNVKISFSWFLCGPIMYREGNNRKKFRNISITKLLISQSTTFIIIYLFVQSISK